MAPEVGRLVLAGLTVGLTHVVSGALVRAAEPGALGLRLLVVECRTGEILRLPEIALGSPDGWGERIAQVLTPILATVEPFVLPTTALFVLSSPEGAVITLDDQPIDEQTPASIAVEPGLRRLRLELPGYEPEELSVMAWRDQTRPVEVALRRRNETSIVRSWWLWTIVGVAAAGAVTGIVLWAVEAEREADLDFPDVRVSVEGAAGPALPGR
jgi:hypothetical protein